MAVKEYSIFIRTNHQDLAKDEIFLKAVLSAAKHVQTTGMLLQDKSKIQVAVQTEDGFSPPEQIALADDILEGATEEEAA